LNEFFPLFAGQNKKYIFDVKKCIYLYNFISKITIKPEQILDFFNKMFIATKIYILDRVQCNSRTVDLKQNSNIFF